LTWLQNSSVFHWLCKKKPDDTEIQAAYDACLQCIEFMNATRSAPAGFHPEEMLASLGLADLDQQQRVGLLSGGQKTRLALASALLSAPNLLLDEPTNHLDIQMLEWLENWLAGFAGAVLVVSHDRTFLDHTISHVLDLDPETHGIQEYPGNYTAYLEQWLSDREGQWEKYQDQIYEIRCMKQDIAKTKQQAAWVEQTTSSRQPGVRRIAKKVAKKALSREKKLERYLDSEDRIEKPRQSWQMKLDFEEPDHIGQQVLRLDALAVGYPGYPPLLSNLNLSVGAGERIVLTGPNGCGKTTLLRTIAERLTPQAGSVYLGASVRLGYMAQEQESLDAQRTALEHLQAAAPFNETEARSFLHYFLFSGDDPVRPASSLSYGERARLSLALLVAQGCNFLLLDEPINHLDIPSRARFETALTGFEGTILAVVHDRYFIHRFASILWEARGGGIQITHM
jgi:ATP-binding cassette subfamily F protein 3